MSETQTILKKFETKARKRLEETKELLKGLLNIEQLHEPEPEKSTESTEENEWDYS